MAVGLVAVEGFTEVVAYLHGQDVFLILAGGLVWWGGVAAVLVVGNPLFLTPQGALLDYVGLPNGLTALRAWGCYPLLLSAVLDLPGDLGFVLWSCVGGPVAFLDALDGYLARHVGPRTLWGKAVDPLMDSLLFSSGAVGATVLGVMPVWLTGVILSRYLAAVLGIPIVYALGRRPELGFTPWGRRNTNLVAFAFFVLVVMRLLHGPVQTTALVVGLGLVIPTTLLYFWELAKRVRDAPCAR